MKAAQTLHHPDPAPWLEPAPASEGRLGLAAQWHACNESTLRATELRQTDGKIQNKAIEREVEALDNTESF